MSKLVRNAVVLLVVLHASVHLACAAQTETVSLAGEWRFAMGPKMESVDKPLPKHALTDSILLPGTTDERGKGPENKAREVGRLTRVHPYVGPAWYQRDVTVPETWRGKHIELFLERTKPSAAWVNDQPIGKQDSLSCPHIYDLGKALTPGVHRLTILVDNANLPPVGDPHQVSDQTQTNWNGIIGRIELRVLPPVWIAEVMRYERYTWTSDEIFTAKAEVAHYGPKPIAKAVPEWSLVDSNGRAIGGGTLPVANVAEWTVGALGSIHQSLVGISAPDKLTFSLSVPLGGNKSAVNHYDIWVYPAKTKPVTPPNVTICHAWDKEARDVLAAGKRVLLMPQGKPANTIEGGFATDFWCWPMFHNKPGTMGLLCDPQHAALAAFPTEFHSNWQWAEIACAARPVILDATPADYRPIVQVIDNFDRNHKLGLVFEARVGPGKLLVVACDLSKLDGKPEARQLLASLTAYATSEKFQPAKELSIETLNNVLGEGGKQ